MKISTKNDLEEMKKTGNKNLFPPHYKVLVGMASCGKAAGADEVFETMRESAEEGKIQVKKTGCIGFCSREPIVEVRLPEKGSILYSHVNPEDANEIIENLKNNEPTLKNAFATKNMGDENGIFAEKLPALSNLDFYSKQNRRILHNCGLVNPGSLPEYIYSGGYFGLLEVLTDYAPEKVIEEIKESRLRGRGGAGFPTGQKWEFAAQIESDVKYIICNADEGDPGAYMDRSILEGDPFSVLEGMAIGAYAIGSNQGYIYVRAEYPTAVKRLEKAIEIAENHSLLGEDIFETGFDFEVEIKKGAGAFVCGEETALIESIESKRGNPSPRPPFPAQSGLKGQPTNINNVETWANVPSIITRGPDWFLQLGSENSKGTKIFSLTGNIDNTGLVEVPMGTSISEIVYGIGGAEKGSIKAVQTGGPSGGCLPKRKFHIPIDYESLEKAGSIMGSGGMIVLDEENCMVEVARYFLDFIQEESCGKCPPCRIGTKRMFEILERITGGEGTREDLNDLEELAHYVKGSSLCGLGQTAPNPVLSTLQYFGEEYEKHLEGECPAGVCFSGNSNGEKTESSSEGKNE